MAIRPKKYTHIDYEALLTRVMKEKISIKSVIEDEELDIARSTVDRNIRKMPDSRVVQIYKNFYVPNKQKKQFPEKLDIMIHELPSKSVKPIVVKEKFTDMYHKLLSLYNLYEKNNSYRETAERINAGITEFGNAKITEQGVRKHIRRFQEYRSEMEKELNINLQNNPTQEEEER